MTKEQLLDQIRAAVVIDELQEAMDSLQLDLEEMVEYQEAKGVFSWDLEDDMEGVTDLILAFKKVLRWYK